MANRRGFTLAEIMIAMTLMLIVSGAAFKLLVTTQRLSRSQTERAGLQSNVRMGSLVVLNDLRELGTVTGGAGDKNDILTAEVSDITYRAMRGMGFICQAPTATQVRITRNAFSGFRDPQAGRDGLYVFIDGDPDSETDDAWLPVAITDVSTTTACPGTMGDGITLTTPNTAGLVGIPVGTPVRFYEVMELKLHQADGKSWLGARSISAGEAIQPVLGPLVDGNGFQLEYLDAGGAITADRTAIKSIRITIRGISDGAVNAGVEGSLTHVQDSLVTQVTLRNAFRP
ncbi:MAG TPA: prepilin-type N-terminal cleavage/methylation domain-containing protein [Gemmatimonadales bacterium]|jgi:prepilin-type N-terminal cleavage/methylation domain-containing protein|nr:prepilin-type N-terminal cleavage/methylation domain-containing protein [Gemmatimonadales bacterium]